jgi:hypothetical protein
MRVNDSKTSIITRLIQAPCTLAACTLALTALMGVTQPLHAGTVYVPNASFESQATPFVDPRIDAWQKMPQPSTWDPNVTGPWDNLAGLFANTPATNADHIVNCDGNQLVYLFGYPQAGFFQDFNSIDWTGVSTHAFNAKFEAGKSYRLTVGLTSSSNQPLPPGATLLVSLYYRDASSNMVTVAATNVVYDTNVFGDLTHLVDFQVNVPTVKTNDAWAGKNIGIQFMSSVFDPQLIGGVWDLDNVRLTELIEVPNFSFESQATPFVDPRIDAWQKMPQPPTWDPEVTGPWDNLTGLFVNTPATNADHIVNCEGNQLVYLFGYPQAGFFQDFNSTDWSGATTHAFNVKYKAGKSYTLTVGLTSSSNQPLPPGATLLVSLYYRDAASNMVTVAATNVAYDTNVFGDLTHLVDFSVTVPEVKASDPWTGQNIGIQFMSSVFDPQLIGGVWDLDNVRLTETETTRLTNPSLSNDQLSFTLKSEPGLPFEIQAATGITGASWTSVTTVTNVTGALTFSDATTNSTQRFYRVHGL